MKGKKEKKERICKVKQRQMKDEGDLYTLKINYKKKIQKMQKNTV